MKHVACVLACLVTLIPCMVVAQNSSHSNDAAKPTADERIQRLISSISEERLQSIVAKLASFGTRETLSDTSSSTRGIGAARQWILDELKRSSPKLEVSFDTYQIAPQGRIPRSVELRNVIARSHCLSRVLARRGVKRLGTRSDCRQYNSFRRPQCFD